ncbi:uncharacterized protein LOC110973527 isoform X2 [Acanthaster planci]|uniref:Uncharacterized protein LOC110973527 isoform X2 n=1 Tax=Acanthaster planci TaxID=133434 RepID=A0A8B7XIZ4_ACAPL|nr:uncharacterized protein LOC110973527 isoform X2 [Acanthaster planci]
MLRRETSDWQRAGEAALTIREHSLAKWAPAKNRALRLRRTASHVQTTSRACGEMLSQGRESSRGVLEDAECSSARCGDRPIQLFVNSSLRMPLCLQLPPSTSVSALKGLLEDKLGIETEKQHLYTGMQAELREPLSLEDHGIKQDTNLELRLVSGLMGGTRKKKSAETRKKSGKKQQLKEEPESEKVSTDESHERKPEESLPSEREPNFPSTAGRRRRLKKASKTPQSLEGAAALPDGKLGEDPAEGDSHQPSACSADSAGGRRQPDSGRRKKRRSRKKSWAQIHPIPENAPDRLEHEEKSSTNIASAVARDGMTTESTKSCTSSAASTDAAMEPEKSRSVTGVSAGATTEPQKSHVTLAASADATMEPKEFQVMTAASADATTDPQRSHSTSAASVAAEVEEPEKSHALTAVSSDVLIKPQRRDATSAASSSTPLEPETCHTTSAVTSTEPNCYVSPSKLHPEHSPSASAPQSCHQPMSLDITGGHCPVFLGPATGNVFIVVKDPKDVAPLLPDSTATNKQPVPSIPSCPQSTFLNVNVGGSQNPTFVGGASGNTFTFGQRGAVSGSTAGKLSSGDGSCSLENGGCASEKSPGASQAEMAADICEESLKTRYMTTGSYVQMIPWVDDDTKHIMDIYTQLQLVNDDGQERRNVMYEDLFHIKTREGHLVKRIICNGFPGLGKSTLIDKIAYDWALGSVEAIKKYKLVFVLKMHALEQSSDLIDAIFDQLINPKTVKKEDLSAYIAANSHKMLILLDGFDEFMTTNLRPKAFGSILNILNRKECPECTVIATTRPSHFAKLASKSLIQKPFTHVRVLGFSAEDVEKYVGRFYSKEPHKSRGLFERIQSSNVLSDLAKSPMLLLLMCLLWRGKSALPDTMSRLYSEAISYIFKRKGVSEEEVSQVVVEIGKIALRGLVSPVQLLSFQEKEFDDEATFDIAIKAGLLTSQRVLKGLNTHNSIQFVHKTFQEFCAAQFCQSESASGSEEFQQVLKQFANPLTYEYLLRFCCGDNEECTNMILKMLQKNQLDDRVLKLSLNCYFESQSQSLPSLDFIKSVVSRSVCLKNFNSDDLTSFVWFLKRVTDQRLGGESTILTRVQEMEILSCNLQSCSKDLAHFVSRMTNLSLFHLRWSWLSDSNLKHIASALGNLANLSQLGLAFNKGLVGSVLSGVLSFSKMHHYMLDSCCGSVSSTDMKPAVVPVSSVFTLVNLDLSGNILSGSGRSLTLLQHMKHLKKLTLDHCHLDTQDFIQVASLVGHMGNLVYCSVDDALRVKPSRSGIRLTMKQYSFRGADMANILKELASRSDLVELILKRIDEMSCSAATWAPSLNQLRHLQRLLVQDCSLQSMDLEPIAVSLSNISTLVELDLSQNKSLRSSGSSLSHLQILTQLRKLKLDFCNFCSQDMRYLAAVIGSIRNLVFCCIDSNFVVNQTSAGIKVVLMSCPLVAADVGEVFKALSKRTDLVQLVMSGITVLSGSSDSWAPHIKQLKHLQRLALTQCSLQSGDIEHIVESVCEMPTLAELDLSKNESLCNSVTQWAHLQRLTFLKKLRLMACDLSLEDMKCLSASVGAMSNLVHCSIDDVLRVTPTVSGVKLDLGHYPFTGPHLADIIGAMSDRVDLVELILGSVNGLSDSATRPWFPHLMQLKHLTRIELHCCSLQGEDIEHIAVSLSNMRTLTELNLSKNESLRDSGASWTHLQHLKQLKKLKVNSCNLSLQDLKYLAALIGRMANLVYCSCAFGHVTFQINPVHAGVRLTMSACPFSATDVTDVLMTVRGRQDIVGLAACHMPELGGSTAVWTPSLGHFKCLGQLILRHCSLQGTDIEHIATLVSEMPNLVKLDLCGNSSLGDSAEFWAPWLKKLTHLQRLNLGKGAITVKDLEHL